MKMVAINGSPRKNRNTSILLNKVLQGANLLEIETEMVHLYDYNYKGCVSCFKCKLKNGISYGKCILSDELSPILETIAKSDAIVFGSPIYFRSVTGEMRSFLERLMYPYLVYDVDNTTLFEKKIPIGFIYTMNITFELMEHLNYIKTFDDIAHYMRKIFGNYEHLISCDTFQFDDYSKYVVTLFNETKKTEVRERQFPIDEIKAFDMGVKLAKQIKGII